MSNRLLSFSTHCIRIGMILPLLGIVSDLYLIGRIIMDSVGGAILLAAVVLAGIFLLRFVVPRWYDRRGG